MLELLGAAGVTLILVRGDVFAWLRRAPGLRAVLKCAMCCGWWVGVALGIAHAREHQTVAEQVLEVLVAGGAVSAVATLLDFTIAYLDSHTRDS